MRAGVDAGSAFDAVFRGRHDDLAILVSKHLVGAGIDTLPALLAELLGNIGPHCGYDKYFGEKMQTLKNQPRIPPAFAMIFVGRPSHKYSGDLI